MLLHSENKKRGWTSRYRGNPAPSNSNGYVRVDLTLTNSEHLGATRWAYALNNLPLSDIDLLLIENVGNLICPAEFNLGEHKKVVISSIPEGDDKPFKYPLMFLKADAVVINKIDLLPYLKFDARVFSGEIKGINRKVEIFQVSCTTGQEIEKWVGWLQRQMDKK